MQDEAESGVPTTFGPPFEPGVLVMPPQTTSEMHIPNVVDNRFRR